jgi:MYXO-CTERM domain-containing protein
VMQGSFDGNPQAECIAAYDPGGSPMTDSAAPSIGDAPQGISPGYHMGLLASDDMINQLMYAVWRGGVLCYTIDENFESFPMSTSVLGILDGPDDDGPFDQLFPDNQDMAIITKPVQQPMANLEGEHDVNISVEELGLDFITQVDHRQARVLALDLTADVGADLNLDGTTGELAIDLDLGEGAITPAVSSCEIAADASELVIDNFGGLLDTIIGMVAGDALSGLSFGLPSFEGLGVTSIDATAAGSAADWLGMYASIGPVAYEGGCDEEGGGCDSGGGCSGTGPVPKRAPWLLLALGAGLLARRRRGASEDHQ